MQKILCAIIPHFKSAAAHAPTCPPARTQLHLTSSEIFHLPSPRNKSRDRRLSTPASGNQNRPLGSTAAEQRSPRGFRQTRASPRPCRRVPSDPGPWRRNAGGRGRDARPRGASRGRTGSARPSSPGRHGHSPASLAARVPGSGRRCGEEPASAGSRGRPHAGCGVVPAPRTPPQVLFPPPPAPPRTVRATKLTTPPPQPPPPPLSVPPRPAGRLRACVRPGRAIPPPYCRDSALRPRPLPHLGHRTRIDGRPLFSRDESASRDRKPLPNSSPPVAY